MKRSWVALPLLLLIASCEGADIVPADEVSAVEQANTVAMGTLQGTVKGNDGTPLFGATVTATKSGTTASASTDDAGQYTLSLPAGSYTVTASAFGFTSKTFTGVTVTGGHATTKNFVLAPAPTHRVSGTVRGAGQPLAAATVTIAGTPLAPAVTDAAGHYSFDAVPNGTYQVIASSGCFNDATTTLTVDGDEVLNFSLTRKVDSFGYSCAPAPFAYIAANTILPLVGDINATTVTLPFPFKLYGQSYITAAVATDGFLSFVDFDPLQYPVDNAPALPDPAIPNAAIYPLWDDYIVDAVSSVRTELLGTAPNRRFVIEWRDVTPFFDPSIRISFEVVLFENGNILTQYQAPFAQGATAAIALENETGTVAFVYSINTPSVDAGTAILFTAPVTATVEGKVIDANDGQPIAGAHVDVLRASSVGPGAVTGPDGTYRLTLAVGTYTLRASAPRYGSATTTVTVSANQTTRANFSLKTARAKVTPASLQIVTTPNQTVTRTLTLQNTGSLDLTFQASVNGGSWLSVTPTSGTVKPGASTILTAKASTRSLRPGTYQASIVLATNAGRQPTVTVPVTLTVNAH